MFRPGSGYNLVAKKPLVVFRLLFRFIFMVFVTHNGDVSHQNPCCVYQTND